MRLGIFAKTFPGTSPDAVLSASSAAGFTVAQYNMACSGLAAMPDKIPHDVPRAVAAAAAATGIEIVAVSGTYNMIHPDPLARLQGHARLSVLAAAAAALPTKLITLCTGTRDADDQWRAHPDNDTQEAWRDLLLSMETAARIAEEHGIDLGIEPELANVVNTAAKARRLIREIGSSRLKIILDPANLFETGTQQRQRDLVSAAVDLLADCIVMGHAKDRRGDGSFTAAGSGVLDFPHYLSCLHRAGFQGPIVTHGLAASEAADVALFLRGTLEGLGIRRPSEDASADEPTRPVSAGRPAPVRRAPAPDPDPPGL
jgi:sugar phosphate isomerase/epimerase